MKRLISMMFSLLFTLSLTACIAPAAEPDKTAEPENTPYVAQHPYEKPEVGDGETLLWYTDGQHYKYSPPFYAVIGFPDEYLEHTDKSYEFDDGPADAKRSGYFGSVLTGKTPVSDAQIVILSSDNTLPWEAESRSAIIYNVSVDDALHVTLSEPRLYTDVSVSFEWKKSPDTMPVKDKSNYASEDGGFHLSDSIADGTPYSQSGIIYDRSMLDMEAGGEYDPGADAQATGDGSAYYRWEFTPLMPGESDILILTNSFNDGLMGVAVHVSVDEDLNWSLDWCTSGICGDDFEIYMTVDGEKYIINSPLWY